MKYFPQGTPEVVFNVGYLLMAIEDQSWEMVAELTESWHPEFKKLVWQRLTLGEREAIAQLKADAQNNAIAQTPGTVEF